MKNHKPTFLSLVFLNLVFLFASCNQDENLVVNQTNESQSSVNTITARKSGSAISAQSKLYTETGTNITWAQLLKTLKTSTPSVPGSTIDVNNPLFETGYGAIKSNTDVAIHVNCTSYSLNTANWKRWFQTDGNTQIFRLFPSEYSIIDSRGGHPRVEAFTTGTNTWKADPKIWHIFKARYTPIFMGTSCCIFQAKHTVNDWALQIVITSGGTVKYTKRTKSELTLQGGMMGKSFDIMVKDDGFNYELYYNDVLKDSGSYFRDNATGYNQFRWGFYTSYALVGYNMMFVSGASFSIVAK